MNPATVKKLHKNVSEFHELRDYLAGKLDELDRLPAFKEGDHINWQDAAIDLQARKLAYKKLQEILDPLVNTPTLSPGGPGFPSDEYKV